MNPRQPGLTTLDLVGDGDDVAIVADLQRAFGVDVGKDDLPWTDVGDVEAALLARFSPGTDAGKCATAMAFYRLRAHLRHAFAVPARAMPATRLDAILPGSPRRVMRALRCDLGVADLGSELAWRGQLGVAFLLGGLPLGVVFGLIWGAWWSGVALLILGAVLVGTDRGSYGDMTLGDLARDIALSDFARFAAQGADRRPAVIWRVLTRIIARHAGVDAARVTRQTRLFGG